MDSLGEGGLAGKALNSIVCNVVFRCRQTAQDGLVLRNMEPQHSATVQGLRANPWHVPSKDFRLLDWEKGSAFLFLLPVRVDTILTNRWNNVIKYSVREPHIFIFFACNLFSAFLLLNEKPGTVKTQILVFSAPAFINTLAELPIL